MVRAIVPAELAVSEANMAAAARILNLTPAEENFLTEPQCRQTILLQGLCRGELAYAELHLVQFWPKPTRGGSRIGREVSLAETTGLAMAMGPKHALWHDAELGPLHGGAKLGLRPPTGATPAEVTEFWRWAIVALADEIGAGGHIVAPDMGTDSEKMAVGLDVLGMLPGRGVELGAFTAKFPRTGGRVIRIPATGLGGAIAADMAWRRLGSGIEGKSVAIAGYGIAGQSAALYAASMGARVVMASNVTGGVGNDSRNGLDIDALTKHVDGGLPIGDFAGGDAIERAEVLSTPVDTVIFAGPGGLVASEAEVREMAQLDPERAAEMVCAEKICCRVAVGITNAPIYPGGVEVLRSAGVSWVGYLVGGGLGAYASQQELLGADPETIFVRLQNKAEHVNRAVEVAATSWGVPFDLAEWALGMSVQVAHARDCGKI